MSKSIDSGSYRIHKQCYDKLDAEKELEKKEKDTLNDELEVIYPGEDIYKKGYDGPRKKYYHDGY